jgi:antitoxin HicB
MIRFAYPVDLSQDDEGRYLVRFPDLPEALTDGDGEAEALRSATDCLGEAVAGRLARREDIPAPSAARGRPLVAPPALIAAKAALNEALRDAGVSNTAFAASLGIHEGEVRRLLDPRHASKIGRLEWALGHLGKCLIVSVGTAA